MRSLFTVSMENWKNLKYHTLVFSIICSKCKNDDEKLFKEEESIKVLKILGFIEIFNYFKNIFEEYISQEFRLKNMDKTRNYLIEEINQNELISKKPKEVCTTLNYFEQFLLLGFKITACISISAFIL